MPKRSLDNLLEEKEQYDPESRALIASLASLRAEIGIINEMKATEGWKMLNKKIRDELRARILELVKDDLKIQTLLALLSVADTKSMSKTLQSEIDKALPED